MHRRYPASHPCTGEKGGGLIGVSYSVKGLLPNPEVSVNPLSAIAPGAARNLFN